MKTLNKKQKTILGVGAAALAVFALSSFGKKETLVIKGFDPNSLLVHFSFRGKDYARSAISGAAMFNFFSNPNHVFRMRPADTQGNVVFGIYEGNNLIEDLGTINVGQYYTAPVSDPNRPLGKNER